MSAQAKIAKVEAQIAKLQEKLEILRTQGDGVDYSSLQPGTEIMFTYGRKEKVTLQGKVLGIKIAAEGVKGGDFVKVAVGEGVDLQVLSIRPSEVISVVATEGAAE